MKNHVYCFGLLLVGVSLANGQFFGLPSLPQPKLPDPLNPKFSFNPPSLPGGPSLSINASGSAGSVAESLLNPKLPSLPGLPGLPGSGSSSSGSNFGLPGLPGLPSLPGLNSSAFKLPGLASLPGLPSSNGSAFGNLPGVPAFLNPNASVGNALDGLQNAVQSANNSANQALSNLQNLSNNLADQIENATNAAQTNIQNQLTGLSAGVRNCVEQNGSPGEAAVNAAAQSAQQCVQKKVNEVLDLVSNTQSAIQAAQLGLNYLRGNLSNCQVNVSMSLTDLPKAQSSGPGCVPAALLSITPETLLLPLVIANNAAQAAGLAQGLQGYAMQCVANLMGDVVKASLQNSLAIGKCYAQLGQNY